MAVYKSKDKHRDLPWCADWYEGAKRRKRYFPTRGEAENCEEAHKASLRNAGLPLTIETLKNVTVGELVQRYLKDVTPTKGCHVSETTVLNKLLRHDICHKSLAFVTRQDAVMYRDSRLKDTWKGKPIAPTTVRREINTIQHIFEIAREEWGYTNLENRFSKLTIRGTSGRARRRRLNKGEAEKLQQACRDCRGLNKYYMPLAIYLAIETGMRLQEIFNLTWGDIDFSNRRIEIRKSKTDHLTNYAGRTIVLTVQVKVLLEPVAIWLIHRSAETGKPHYEPTNRIFHGMTKDAFKQSWADVLKRANITDLHFHDLRREAGSRFDEADLRKSEHNLMMGHTSRDMASLYIASQLKSIQDKLDRHTLNGKTLDEVAAVAKKRSPSEINEALAIMGLSCLAPPMDDSPTSVANIPTATIIPFPKAS